MSTSPQGQLSSRSATSNRQYMAPSSSQISGAEPVRVNSEDNHLSCGSGIARSCPVCYHTCPLVPSESESKPNRYAVSEWLSDTLGGSATALRSILHSNERKTGTEEMAGSEVEEAEADQVGTVDEIVCRPRVQVQFRRRNPHEPPNALHEDERSSNGRS
ncbi:hypothetical protein V865_005635 [Kwoniella europaea PYCC6329]|uniref:Uncharacterized protein n=1 Tax=Kwoniella europaea PYCC6329 TaxID=1423913 RepID=A0AAX4KN02_9TREE